MTAEESAASTAQGRIDRSKLALIAVDRTFMSMVVTDPNEPDNPIVLANPAFLDLVGYTADEIIGRNCRFMQGPDTAEADVAVIRDAVARGDGVTHDVLNYRKDGSSFWNQIHISPIYDDAGKLIYFFGSHIDVTHRRRAFDLEQAELGLLREIDHRAKNALALVQGIVRLTRADDIGQYSRAVQGRVNALASAHTLLAGGNWRGVPIDELLKAELRSIADDRVDLSGPAVAIDAGHVQPFALVLHEIVANAIEHGALSSPEGSLAIHWEQAPDGLAISFQECGGPSPVPPATKGFGLSIADAIATGQLNGRLQRDWKDAGLESRLTIHAAA